MDLICPICGSKLNTFDKSLVCSGHHCFDIARQGYVNLLTVQQKHSLHPGDTREQVLSRLSGSGVLRPHRRSPDRCCERVNG